MNDRLPSLSSEPAGQHHAHQRLPELACLPPNAAPVSPTAIENQFAFAHQQPDASVGLDAGFNIDFGADFDADIAANSEANFDIDIDIDVSALTIGDATATGVDDVPPFLGQYGRQAHPDAGSWNPLGATSLRIQPECHIAPGFLNQQLLSPSTATPSQTASSVFDTCSIRSGVTATSQSSTICEFCSKPYRNVRQKNRHQRAAHGNTFRCRCLYGSGRRDNYLRHLGNCRKRQDTDQAFTCKCGERTDDFNNHWTHVGVCKLPPGRPAASSRKVQWLPFPSAG